MLPIFVMLVMQYGGGIAGGNMRRQLVAAAAAALFLGGSAPSTRDYLRQGMESCSPLGKLGGGVITACLDWIDTSEFGARPPTDLEREGDAALGRFDGNAALDDFDRAIAANPEDARAYIGRGLAYIQKDRFDSAIDDFDRAIAIDPHDGAGFVDRGNAYRAKGKYERAIEDYGAALKIGSDDPFAYNQRGTTYARLEKRDLAKADFSAAIAIDPTIAAFYFNRFYPDNLSGDHDQALIDLQQLHKLDPDFQYYDKAKFTQALRVLGQSFDCRTQQERAIAAFNWLTEIDPKVGMYRDDRARCYSAHGDNDAAIADYDLLLENGARDVRYVLERAEVEARAGKNDEALKDYSYAIAYGGQSMTDEFRFEAYFNRGLIYQAAGDYAPAIADLSSALQAQARDPQALVARAKAYAQSGNIAAAGSDFDAAVLYDTGTESLLARGNFRQHRGDYAGAISDYGDAIKRAPADPRPLNNRCFARAVAAAELEQGLVDCAEALKLSPNDASAIANRGLVLLRMGHFDEAITAYDAALVANPQSAWASFGRGLARLRVGDKRGGGDLSAAKAADDNVAAAFAAMGLSPA